MSTMRIARFAILLAVALALVITGAVAGAAGQALILGQSNSAGGQQTRLTADVTSAALRIRNLSGAPLILNGPTTKPPLLVNSRKKVQNLNAELVDGKSASAFMPSATYRLLGPQETIGAGDSATVTVDCGTDKVLAGGYSQKDAATNLADSYPEFDGSSWVFLFVNTAAAGSDSLSPWVLCAGQS